MDTDIAILALLGIEPKSKETSSEQLVNFLSKLRVDFRQDPPLNHQFIQKLGQSSSRVTHLISFLGYFFYGSYYLQGINVIQILEFLISRGCDLNQPMHRFSPSFDPNFTFLIYPINHIFSGFHIPDPEVIDVFIKNSANLNTFPELDCDTFSYKYNSVLEAALNKLDMRINTTGVPLNFGDGSRLIKIISMLIKVGADPTLKRTEVVDYNTNKPSVIYTNANRQIRKIILKGVTEGKITQGLLSQILKLQDEMKQISQIIKIQKFMLKTWYLIERRRSKIQY